MADRQDLTLLLFACAWNGHNDLVDRVFLGVVQDSIPAAHDPDTMDIGAVLSCIVINDTADIGVKLLAHLQFPHDYIACLPGADDHGIAHMAPVNLPPVQKLDQPVGKPGCTGQQKQGGSVQQEIAPENFLICEKVIQRVECRGSQTPFQYIHQLLHACKPPQAGIETHSREDQHGNHRIKRDHVHHRIHIRKIHIGQIIEPEPERKIGTQINTCNIQRHEEQLGHKRKHLLLLHSIYYTLHTYILPYAFLKMTHLLNR